MPRPNFRFAAKRVLLTYSQVCEFMHKEAVFHIIDDKYPISLFRVCEETHQEGGRHIHACFTFYAKVDSRDVGLFDIACGNPDCTGNHHPNIRPIAPGQAHWARSIEYCTKEDLDPFTNVADRLTWGQCLEQSNTAAELLGKIKANHPKEYLNNLAKLEYAAAKEFEGEDPNTLREYNFPGEEEPRAWPFIERQVQDWNAATHSLVLEGPAGCGKTTWAKVHCAKPALWVRHPDALNLLRPHHRSIIFDDMCFKHQPPATQKSLTDVIDIAHVHIRYRYVVIPPGISRIFTCNEYPFAEEGAHADAIGRRLKRVVLL